MNTAPTLGVGGFFTDAALGYVQRDVTPFDIDVTPGVQVASLHQHIVASVKVQIVTSAQG